MQPLSVASIIEKNRLSSATPFVPLLDIEVVNPSTGVVVEALHICRNSEDITFQGETYAATPFDFDTKAESGGQSKVTLRVRDITKALQGRMQAYGGGIGFNVTLMIVNTSALTEPAEAVEYFQVIGASAQNYDVQFTLGAENAVTVTFPRRTQRKDFCQWRYKDPDTCAYAGALPSCDLTLQGPNGCGAHDNSPNFGGYPGINANGIRYA